MKKTIHNLVKTVLSFKLPFNGPVIKNWNLNFIIFTVDSVSDREEKGQYLCPLCGHNTTVKVTMKRHMYLEHSAPSAYYKMFSVAVRWREASHVPPST